MLPRAYAKLLGRYGPQGWWPLKGTYDPTHKKRKKTPAERFEIACGAILTSNTSWTNAQMALDSLAQAKKLDRESIRHMPPGQLARLIVSSGYHNQKAKRLKEFAAFEGKSTRENLLSLWGIGEETADSILLYAYDEAIFVVDTYTKRIFSRMGVLPKNPTYEMVQQYFHDQLPLDAKLFNEYHALIVKLAKEHCRVQPICEGCPIKTICKTGKRSKR